MSSELNTTNPQLLIYENNYLRIEILNGIHIESVEQMKVTLRVFKPKAEVAVIRHGFDLYNDNQLSSFIRKVGDRIGVGILEVRESLNDLITKLENYRIKEQQLVQVVESMEITSIEKQAARKRLRAKSLIELTLNALQQTGVQGERENAGLLYFAMTSRLLPDPLSVICLAESGSGKSYLMEKVSECIPAYCIKENTQFTGASFYYFRRDELKGKVILIEDLDGAQSVMFPIRELTSKKRISKSLVVKDKNGHLRTINVVVEGPVCIIGCTTRESVYRDNANRSILIHLDSSKAQDKRVMDYQKKKQAGKINEERSEEVKLNLQHNQLVLEPVKVINPYAELIELPTHIKDPRRALPIVLQMINTIAFYRQYQKEQKVDESTGEVYIECDKEDIAWAFKLLREPLFRKRDELSRAVRSFYESLKKLLKEKNQSSFYGNEIRRYMRIAPRTLSRYMKTLKEYGFLKIEGGKKHKTGFKYSLTNQKDQSVIYKEIDIHVMKMLNAIPQRVA